jgi:hypothetical protein
MIGENQMKDRKYQIIYQGYPEEPNQELLEYPIDFQEANKIAAEMQAEYWTKLRMKAKDVQEVNGFYVVSPVF